MTRTEDTLVERMAQHQWLRCRAEFFESKCFDEVGNVDEKRLALFLRYRTSHERAFHKCFNELLKLGAERHKVEIGFESQKRAKEEHTRKQEQHQMAKKYHEVDLLLAEAKVEHQQALTLNQEITHAMHSIAIEKAKKAA
jgi:hypothetical protein